MSGLPVVSGKEARRAFEKVGFVFDRQRGSHMTLVRKEPFCALTIPDHRELDAKTHELVAGLLVAGLRVGFAFSTQPAATGARLRVGFAFSTQPAATGADPRKSKSASVPD